MSRPAAAAPPSRPFALPASDVPFVPPTLFPPLALPASYVPFVPPTLFPPLALPASYVPFELPMS
uniref:hypothetical protein n=1 Tax=Nonomuraea pusilla TaxID=46177 RepID=UPI0006E201F7|nr:hypothetical protein [Nonomuraea pusilla]